MTAARRPRATRPRRTAAGSAAASGAGSAAASAAGSAAASAAAAPREDRPAAPTTAPRDTPAAPVDGRRARTVRTRAAIIAALLDLVRAGDINPTAAAIARRARISVRSIGQHFPSRAELFAAAAAVYLRRADPPEPAVAVALPDRLAAFLPVRARELETSRPIRSSAALFAAEYPVVADAIAGNAARRRDQLQRVFAPELARAGRDTVELLDLVLGGRVWDALRERGLPPERAQQLVASLVTLVLDAVPPAPRLS